MSDCMPKEQSKAIRIVQNYCLEATNMTEDEAYDFAYWCYVLGFKKDGLIAEGDKNAACDEKAASAEDLKRKMMEDATSYKTPCAHPIEQVQKTYCPQEGVYEYYCHNCGERWWVKKHE